MRRTASLGGLFYLITFASLDPGGFLLAPVLNDANYILSSGADNRCCWAASSTWSTLSPPSVPRSRCSRWSSGRTSRWRSASSPAAIFEAAVIVIGIISLLTVVTMRQPGATGAEADSLVVARPGARCRPYDWTFLLGPNLMAAMNALLLGTLMYKSGLVPRGSSRDGPDRRPAAARLHDRDACSASPSTVPPVVGRGRTDLLLGAVARRLYLVVKGFKPSPPPASSSQRV